MKHQILKTSIFIIASAIMVTACRKEKQHNNTYPEENPLAGYLSTTGFDEMTYDVLDNAYYEMGFSFKSNVKGKIKAIVYSSPANASNVRVTIWDESENAIRTESIPTVTANLEVEHDISDLAIEVGKTYVITLNNNDWYLRMRPDGSAASYPVVSGNIVITGYGYRLGAAQAAPTNWLEEHYTGDISFVFQQED